MPDYVFPADDLDRPAKLHALLGSFWSSVYTDQATLQGYTRGRAMLERQVLLELAELEDSMSRFTVPLTQDQRWQPLILLQSQMNASTALLRYGDDAVYGNQPGTGVLYHYGIPQTGLEYSFPLPAHLVGGETIFNRLQEPSAALVRGVDYVIDVSRGSIAFRDNPFDNELIPQRKVYDGSGNVVDIELGLWLCRAKFDVQNVNRHYGYVVGLAGARPEVRFQRQYRDFVNSHFDSVVAGTTIASLRAAIAACTGIPFVLDDGEVVELVSSDARGRIIATDRRVYRFPATAVPAVSAGDTTRAGQALVTTVRLIEFQDGSCPSDIRALAIGRGLLDDGYAADLVFENKSVPLVVEEDVDGYTKVSFQLGGYPTDVEQFFDDLHAAGVAAGNTLAMMLDQRTNKTGQPRAGSLPAEINPLAFLTQNVLRQNASLLYVAGDLGDDALGLRYLRQIRKLMPPHTLLLSLVELEADLDVTIMDGPGDENGPGYTEDLQPFLAAELTGDDVDTSYVSENPRAFLVSDRCL